MSPGEAPGERRPHMLRSIGASVSSAQPFACRRSYRRAPPGCYRSASSPRYGLRARAARPPDDSVTRAGTGRRRVAPLVGSPPPTLNGCASAHPYHPGRRTRRMRVATRTRLALLDEERAPGPRPGPGSPASCLHPEACRPFDRDRSCVTASPPRSEPGPRGRSSTKRRSTSELGCTHCRPSPSSTSGISTWS